jgi:hypothetical protein
MATEHDSWLEGLGVNVGSVLEGAAQAVQDAGSTIADMGAGAASSISGAASEAVSSVAQAGSEVTDSIANTVSEVADGASEGLQKVEDVGSAAVSAVENVASDVAHGVAGAATSAADAVSDVVSDVADDVQNFAQDVAESASGLYQKAKEAIEGIDLPYQFGGIQAPFEKSQQEAEADGLVVAARPLSSAELADARLIFADSIDYSKVTVDGGSIGSVGSSRTIGNSVHLESKLFQPGSSETTTSGRRILVHELTHVWQYQHQGWTYAPKAIWAQAKAAVHGDRNGAYDWKPLVAKGIPWDEWNPEAQADAVEEYNKALHFANAGNATAEDYKTLEVLAKYVRNVGSSATDAEGPRDPVFNCANGMRGEVFVEQDGSWSCRWSWTYIGTTLCDSPDICDEFILTGENGQVLDGVKGSRHDLRPGQTYLGTGRGKRKMAADNLKWKLSIPYKQGYVGLASGSVAVNAEAI